MTKKLVRDRIHLLEKSGRYTYRRATAPELRELLNAKLREEVEEFIATPNPDEYCDVSDVVTQLAMYYGIIGTQEQWVRTLSHAKQKQERNGSFGEYWVRESVEPAPEQPILGPGSPSGRLLAGLGTNPPPGPPEPLKTAPADDGYLDFGVGYLTANFGAIEERLLAYEKERFGLIMHNGLCIHDIPNGPGWPCKECKQYCYRQWVGLNAKERVNEGV